MNAVCRRFAGGPVGLSTLAICVGEEPETVEDAYEPFLLQLGLLQRTPRGRVATAAAWRHLGLAPPEPQVIPTRMHIDQGSLAMSSHESGLQRLHNGPVAGLSRCYCAPDWCRSRACPYGGGPAIGHGAKRTPDSLRGARRCAARHPATAGPHGCPVATAATPGPIARARSLGPGTQRSGRTNCDLVRRDDVAEWIIRARERTARSMLVSPTRNSSLDLSR